MEACVTGSLLCFSSRAVRAANRRLVRRRSTPASDAAADLVEGCTTFVDRTDPTNTDGRVLLWDPSIAVDDSRCLQIKVGQTVTWGDGSGGPGDFKNHPLIAFEGDDNNPIENLIYATGVVTFDAPGTFGYVCGTHPAMKGAVKVVP